MAALDFPASPTDGQLFVGGNGVTYSWSAAKGAWVALGLGVTAQGDFCAILTTGAIPTTLATLILPTIISGNLGGFYSTSTGRFTPPAGRYAIYFNATVNNAAVVNINAHLRKNGTDVAPMTAGTVASTGGTYGNLNLQYIADANGSDWFDIQTLAGIAGTNINIATFGAHPILPNSTLQGNTTWRSLGIINPAGVASVDFQNFPSDINQLQCFFDLVPNVPGSTAAGFVIQMYDSTGTLDATSGHYLWSAIANAHNNTLNGAPATSTSAQGYTSGIVPHFTDGANNAVGALGITGSFRLPNIKATGRYKNLNFATSHVNALGNGFYSSSGGGTRTINGAITGIHMIFGGGYNIASGTVELWGSP